MNASLQYHFDALDRELTAIYAREGLSPRYDAALESWCALGAALQNNSDRGSDSAAAV